MKTSKDIVLENRFQNKPNAGIKALSKACFDNPNGFCIIDKDDKGFSLSHRDECPDCCSCHKPDFMLACVSSRGLDDIGEKAIKIYNEALVNV